MSRLIRSSLALALLLTLSAAASGQQAAVPASRRQTVSDATARLNDADTALRLSSEGTLLYEQEDVKLDGYQYCSQAVAYAERGDFRQSLRTASKALHIGQVTGNTDLLGKAHRDMAIAYSYAGSLDKAEEFAREALKYPSKDPTQVIGPAYKVIGDVQARQGHFDAAAASYAQALQASSARYRPLVQSSLVNLLIDRGELAQARQQLDDLPAFDQPALTYQVDRSRARLLLAENKAEAARELYRALAARASGTDAAYQRVWALDGLARSEQALGHQDAAAEAWQQAVAGLDEVRAKFRSEEFKLGVFSDVQRIFEAAIDTQSKLGHAAEAFRISERSRARALLDGVRGRSDVAASDTLDAPKLQAMLHDDERVIEFHSLHDRLLAWVIGPHELREVSFAIPHADLGVLVEAYRNAIVEGSATVVTGADQLGRLLIAPLGLQAGQRLVIVPHGALHYLPFQALREDGQYLIERHPLSIAPSITVAAQLAQAAPHAKTPLIAFGNPDVGPELALPGAESEVKALAAFFPHAETFLNAQASKSEFRRSAGQARLLHVAAHAEADRVDPMYSRILLANESGKQNFLEAHEVYGMKLQDVALVTLSACDSGLGRVADGDEVLGLPRAFLSAGSSALIVSLWPVADDTTALLMTTLYGQLARGVDVQRAMQAAQLAVLAKADYHHPFFWAPFNVVGNWRMQVGGGT